MSGPIFSLARVIGSEVHSTKGGVVAVVTDVIWNQDTARVTYLVISPDRVLAPEVTREPPATFAIHPSYFYFDGEDDRLVFSGKIGKDNHSFFLDLPERYDEIDVEDLNGFKLYLGRNTAVATHRSDNE